MKKIEKVIVTYHDNETKEFDALMWSIFGENVKRVAKKIHIEYEKK